MRRLFSLLTLTLLACSTACTSEPSSAPAPYQPPSTTSAVDLESDLPIILAFGDSLTVGHGVDRELSYPAQLQRELDARGYAYQVVNQGQDGDTTSGGVARLEGAVRLNPEIVILELGGNDGLRGVPVEVARQNLRTMIERFQSAGARVVLAGMSLPLNYGPDYIRDFEAIYRDLAEEFDVVLMPFFLEGLVEEYERYIQADGIHPTGEGYTIVVANVLRTIEPFLTTSAQNED